MVAALVTHDPDPARSPLRRAGTTALVSLLIASLTVAAAAIYGVITGNSNVNPTDSSVVFQEKGTGARFVYLDSDRRLHPVLNYASGLLLSTGQKPSLKTISSEKLAKVALGDPVGIPDAPDSLPRPDTLIPDRWSVCNDGQARSTLLVGDRLTDGSILARSGRGLLVRDAGQTYLVHDNRRFAIPAARLVTTLRALRYADQQPWPVSPAWINAVPAGPDLAAPALPEGGGRSSIGDFEVGDLVTDGRQVAVILSDGAAALTDMQALLFQAVPGVARPTDIGGDFLRLPPSRTVISDKGKPDGLPPTIPALLDVLPARACVTLPVDPRNGDGIRIDPSVPAGVTVAGKNAAPGAVLADQVHVARGRGALAVVAASPSAPAGSGTVSLVTDAGLQFPLAGRALLPKLGYGDVRPRQIPSQLISLLPVGPALDPARARRTNPQ